MDVDAQFVLGLLPERPEAGHKGTFGHVFVIAGSRGFTGAMKLAAEAAARSGVGLVTVGVPETLADVAAAHLMEAMSLALPDAGTGCVASAALDVALEFAASKNAVVIGPGLSQHPETQAFVVEFVRRCPAPTLVDADGLNNLANHTDAIRHAAGPRVLTPHPGEMARLAGKPVAEIQAGRERVAAAFAREYGCVVVLKGHRTVIAESTGKSFVNTTGNSGLATGGTGDVLAGLIGGLMAQGMTCRDASLVGTYLHGCAGDLAAQELGERALIARDVIAWLPKAWRQIEAYTP